MEERFSDLEPSLQYTGTLTNPNALLLQNMNGLIPFSVQYSFTAIIYSWLLVPYKSE